MRPIKKFLREMNWTEERLKGEIIVRTRHGGTLLDMAREWNLDYGELSKYVRFLGAEYEEAKLVKNDLGRDIYTGGVMDIMSVDVTEIVDKESNRFKPVAEWPSNIRRSVQKIKLDGKGAEVSFYSKLRVMELLGKELQLYRPKGTDIGGLLGELLKDRQDLLEEK